MPDPGKAAEEEDDDKEESDRQERGGATSTVRDKMEGYKWSDAEWAEWNRRWQWGTSWQTSWTQHTSGEKKDSETGVTGVPASAMPSTGVDHSDPWQRPNVDPWSRRTSMSGAPHESGRHDGWWGTQTYHKGDYSDPPSWSGWGYRLWRRAVIRWNDHTDIAVWRRADRVLRTLEWDLQAKLDHISEATLASPAFLTEILAVLDVLAGEKADSERKRAVRAALFEGSRRADESIAQYALRRESQFEVASRYITLPDDVKGILLEEQSGLTKQAMQNLRVLTKGQHSYSEVKKALHVLDVEEESMIKPGKVSYFEDLAEYAETDLEDDDDEEIFLAIENEHVAEEEAVALLADLQQDRRRTWKENKLLKAARRKDRRHFDDKSSRPARPFNRRRMSVEELKKITFCGNCGKKGHWREDCSESVKDSSRQPKTKTNAFVFLGISEEAKSSAAFFLGALSDAKSMNGACFLELNPGQAIVDPGASQDLIGLPSFEKLQTKLARVGLQAIKLDEAPGKAAGVGGSAKTLFMALSPCILGGQPGIIKLTVVEDDVPQLLSIGLLEHGEAVIDTGTDKIHFRKFGTEARMTRLPSGHRTLDVAEWSGGDFPIPEKLTRELGLCPGAFNLSPSARRAYMSGFACFGDRSQLFQFFQIQKSQAGEVRWLSEHVLGNFVEFRDFPSDFSAARFRSTWLVLDGMAWLLERNARRAEPDVCDFTSHVMEVTDCPLESVGKHWSNSRIVSLFSTEPLLLILRDDVCCRVGVGRPNAVSSQIDERDKPVEPSHLDPSAHGGIRTDVQQSEEVSHQIRGGQRSLGESLVSLHSEDDHHAWRSEGIGAIGQDNLSGRLHTFQGRCERSDEASSLSASQGIRGQGSQPARDVDQVLSVSDQDQLCEVQQGQPSSCSTQEQVCGSGDPRERSTHAEDSHGFRFSCLDECTDAGSGATAAGSDATADSEHRGGHVSGDVPCGGRISSSPALSGRGDAAISGTSRDTDSAAVPGSTAHHEADRSCLSAGCCLSDDVSGGAAPANGSELGHGSGISSSTRRGGVGSCLGEHERSLSGAAGASFTSCQSARALQCTDSSLQNWLLFPCNKASKRYLARRGCQDCFVCTRQTDEGDQLIFLVKDAELVDDLVCGDYPEGREAHLTKKQKQLLLNSLERISTEFSHGSKNPAESTSSEKSDKKSQEPEGHQEQSQESHDRSRNLQEPESHSRVREHFAATLSEGEREDREIISRPIRSSRSNPPSSSELRALGFTDVRPCSHGDVMEKSATPQKVMELFSPPRVSIKAVAQGLTLTEPSNFDLTEGWDALNYQHRQDMWKVLREQKPDVVIMSPECRMFSQLMSINLSRIPVEKLTRDQMRALIMWNLCLQVADFQLQNRRHFFLEQPAGASSWQTHAARWLLGQKGVRFFSFDQCELGLQVSAEGLSRKTTSVATSHAGIAFLLSQYQCTHGHQHVHLENGLPRRAQVYPEDMVQTVIDGILAGPVEFSGVAADDHDLMDEEAEDQEEAEPQPRTPGTLQRDSSVLLTEEQKKKILRMHLNMGHLSKEQMLSMLKAAGAREGVLKFVKEKFECTYCMRQRKPVERRHATIPRTFSFNRIIGLDFFYLSFGGRTFAFLNAVCHGTNFQQVGMLKNYDGGVPSSKETWSLFSKIWIQPFGIPETMVCDGGSEFKQHFERAAEQQGILQIITDAASPWQNGRVERHGGWVKDRAELEINSGQTVLTDSHDLEELILATVSCKNRWYSRGGYSPCQLVFGVNPRVPTELLSDDALQELGWEEIECDAFDQDTATAAYNRSHQIRQKARQLCIEAACRDRIKSSIKQRTHKQRQWAVGQWVHVWRKFPGTGQGHLTRARWTGPGVVVLQAGHTVWVSMRARLWKCNSDQLRPATHHESIGADMARSGELQDLIAQGRSTKAGAVDVTTEGTPDDTGDGKVPSIEIDKPMVQESIADDLRTADTAKDIESEGQHLPLRQVSVPRPVIPEETEGSVADTVSEATAGSKRKSQHSDQDSASNKKKIVEETVPRLDAHRVKRPVEDQEQANLEKIALKTLRRLEREEKMRKISERKEAVASASSETPNQETTSSSSSMALQQPSTETSADGFAPQDALMAELTEQGLSFLELKIEDSCLMTKPVKTKSQEFDMKLATDEEKKGFKASDEAEWKTILDLKAVEVLNPAESRKVRRDHPHRILPSRFVRRKKPMPGLGQWKFKSRWCVLGHCDPDTGSYSTYSPMPMTESISIFFQLCTNMDMSVTFCDVTQAFCQSEPLDRPEGDLYVEACEGLGLPEGTVIRLVAPVYGLEDAPLRWHQTVINFLRSLGFERSLLEPCWYVRRDARHEVEAMILVEVDDLNVAARKDVKDELLLALNQRFRFGKMEYDEADFAGRHVRVLPGRIEMNQEKYIIEKLHPLKLPLGRKGDKSSRLKPDEFEAFRSMLYKVAWVAHQTRPEAAGVVSILSSRLKEGTIEDVSCLNKLIQHLRNTAQQSLTLHRFSNDKMILIAASDAGGVDSLPPDKSSEIDNVQGAWIIMAADRLPSANQRIKVSILSWRSSKLRRRVASTLASEALAFSQSLSEVEWIQIMIRDIIKGDVKRTDWTESLTPYVPVLKENCELAEKLEQCHVTDAKSLFDALKKESPMSRQDRRTSVELSIILEALQKARSVIRWAPHPRMVADGLTKADITRTNGALEELLRTSRLTLWDEKQELNLRKDDPAAKGRSRRASTRHRSLEASEESFVLLSRINKNLGVLYQVTFF